jgi:hypothetical protein
MRSRRVGRKVFAAANDPEGPFEDPMKGAQMSTTVIVVIVIAVIVVLAVGAYLARQRQAHSSSLIREAATLSFVFMAYQRQHSCIAR